MKLDSTVSLLEERYGGGSEFFEVLYEAAMTPPIYAGLYAMIKDAARYTFILTGRFGEEFLQWMNKASKPYAGYLLYPGGLRDGQVKSYANYYLPDPNNWMVKACVVDATIYSGTARATLLHQLQVAKTLDTYVAYDGMPDYQYWCRSLYRYHPVGYENTTKEP